MYPILITKFLTDSETLKEYGKDTGLDKTIPFSQIRRRLIGIARKDDPTKNDCFYEGLGEMYLNGYHTISDFIWQLPYEIANRCLMWKRNHVYIKKECFTEWMEMINSIPPSLLLAAFMMDRFSMETLTDKERMGRFIQDYLMQFRHTAQPIPFLPDLEYIITETKGLNDLHIHLNGSTESDVIWQYILQHPLVTIRHYKEAYSKDCVRKLAEQIIGDFDHDMLLKNINNANRLRTNILTYVATDLGIIRQDFAPNIESMYIPEFWGDFRSPRAATPIIDEILFCIITMNELRKNKYELAGRWFHQYLLIKGLIHQFSVMQHSQVGFPQFQLISENSFRWGAESYYEQRFLQLAGNGSVNYLSMLEGRFSPKDNSLQNLSLISRIIKGFRSACTNNESLKDTKLALVAHFIKKKESPYEKKFPIRHRFLRKDLKKRAIALAITINSNKEAAKYVRGIDAAANEMDAGPDVFAHTFRYLKKHGISHCTYHVGEDFKHLLTGLRTICEAIEFLELQTGDRLGHCTAAGISPRIWRARVGKTCILPQGEWLDNLVFVWNIIKESQDKDLQSASLSIESSIAEYSYRIYGNSYPPYLLAEAWKIRKYNPFLYLEQNTPTTGDEWDCVDTNEEADSLRKRLKDKDINRIWSIYHRIGNNEYDKLIEVETDGIISIENLSVVQNIILERMALKGIVIEALPSSNLNISYYRHLNEYHLEKWLDTEQKSVLLPPIVLGTDDPGIFMTNIYNEYAQAYLHLETQGRSSSNRIKKIEDIFRDSQTYNFKRD